MSSATAIALESQARADELEERLIDFAVRIIKLSARLPRNPAGKVLKSLLRGGDSSFASADDQAL